MTTVTESEEEFANHLHSIESDGSIRFTKARITANDAGGVVSGAYAFAEEVAKSFGVDFVHLGFGEIETDSQDVYNAAGGTVIVHRSYSADVDVSAPVFEK